ncbi:hypothetical protein DY252_05680 [Thalassospira indica]|uniref:Uncharacterized protein n=1 Tax=Thalassospira indica TaxID=1891279 RepID=A0ABN5NED3_9PROT|nr:hypothetical protein DY252_05680 [Thalassospira indica]
MGYTPIYQNLVTSTQTAFRSPGLSQAKAKVLLCMAISAGILILPIRLTLAKTCLVTATTSHPLV